MIDILEKIEQIRIKRKWSEYELSKRADIPQSTINAWYRKHQVPTLYSLDKISRAFGITLSVLVAEEGDPVELTPFDQELLRSIHMLEPAQKQHLLQFLKSLTEDA